MAQERIRRRRGAAIAVSTVVHAAIFGLLALNAPSLRLPTARFAPDVTLYLEPLQPRSRSPGAATPPSPHQRDKASTAAPVVAAVAPRPTGLPAPPLPRLPTPSPAAGAASPASAPAIVAGSSPAPSSPDGNGHDWRVRPGGGDVHGLVREAVGCGHVQYLKLTAAEQAACDRRFASARSQDLPRVDAIPAGKRAYYDAVLQKREDQRYGAFKELHDKQVERGIAGMKTHGVDINVGYHCTFKFGAGAKEANDAAGKKLGFPPCPIRLPGADPPPP